MSTSQRTARHFIDLSGEALHRRCYRKQAGIAPLKETLPAALLRMSGWDPRSPLIDPMCGSGTIAIEAALWSAHMAPGLLRARFGFERWADYGEEKARELRALRGALRRDVSSERARIVASDVDPELVRLAGANARAAGVRLTFREQSILDLRSDGDPRTLITNPPYGIRLEANPDFVNKLSGTICRLHGWRVGLLAGSKAYERAISLRPTNKVPLVNGDVECEFLLYDVK